MPDGVPDESGNESGSALREKLEATIEANKATAAELNRRVASAHEFVTPEDLAGVPLDQLDAKAAEISQARAAERQALLVEELKRRGVAEDQLEAALANLGVKPQEQPAPSQVASLGQLPGNVPAVNQVPEGVRGYDRIRAAIGARKS
jgi:hypothetical protein